MAVAQVTLGIALSPGNYRILIEASACLMGAGGTAHGCYTPLTVELRQLKYFLKIVEYGNMTRASEVLHIAQPALSQQMRNLEEELGVRLFDRMANGVRPTAAALILRTQARQILRQVEEASVMVRSELDRPTGEVSIGLPSSTARMAAIPLLQAVRAEYPGIGVKFIEAPSAGLLKLLETGDADMVIAVDVTSRHSLNILPLVEERMFAIELRREGQRAARSMSVNELATLPLVLPAVPNSIREYVDAALRRAHLGCNLVAEINSTSLLLQAVRAGVGATVLPLSAAGEDVEAGRLTARQLAGTGSSRRLQLCTLERGNQTAAATVVHALVPGVVRQLIEKDEWKGARAL